MGEVLIPPWKMPCPSRMLKRRIDLDLRRICVMVGMAFKLALTLGAMSKVEV